MPTPLSDVLFRIFNPLHLYPSHAAQHTSMLNPIESQHPSARPTNSHEGDHVEVTLSLFSAAAAADVVDGQQADTPRLLPASATGVERPLESEPQEDMGDQEDVPSTVLPQHALIASAGQADFSLLADATEQHGARNPPEQRPTHPGSSTDEIEEQRAPQNLSRCTTPAASESPTCGYRIALSPSPQRISSLPAAVPSQDFATLCATKRPPYQHLPWPPHGPKTEGRDSAQPQNRTDSFGSFRSHTRPGELVEGFNKRWKHDKFIAVDKSPKLGPGNHGSDGTVNTPPLAKSPPVAPRVHGLALAVAAGEGKQGVVHVERQVLPSLLWSSNGAERTAARERAGQELCRQLVSQGKQPGEGTWTEHGVRWTWTTRPGPTNKRATVPSVAIKQVGHACPTDLTFDAFPFLVSYLLPEQWRDKSARGANSGRDFNTFYQNILLAASHPVSRTGKRRNIVRIGKIEHNLVIPIYMKPISGGGSFINPFPQFELLHRPRDGWKILSKPVPSGLADAPGHTVNPIVSQKRDAPPSDDGQPSKKARTTPSEVRASSPVNSASTASSSTSDLRARLTDKLKAIDRWTTISEDIPESRQLANRQIARIQKEIFEVQAKMRGEE